MVDPMMIVGEVVLVIVILIVIFVLYKFFRTK